MDPGDQDLLVSYQEQQEGIFPGNGYSGPNITIEGQEEAEEVMAKWSVTRPGGVSRVELDKLLQMPVNPNEVYNNNNNNNNNSAAETASETDSGISDDQRPDSPLPAETTPARLFQLVYGVSVKTEAPSVDADLVSIELGSWKSQVLLPEACIVDTAPGTSSGARRAGYGAGGDPGTTDSLLHFPDLSLTEEEKRLLSQEGIVLPSNLPLTKAEERILKKVRRKIRNKQSAQESRRRKKEYIDGLESRVAACTAQNQELQKQVEQLEHHNLSLITQLRRLQSLIKQTSNKAAQTSTCVMILACSLVLLIFPSYSPFRLENPVSQQGYKPTGVISRTILTDVESSRRSEGAEPVDLQGDRRDPADPLQMLPTAGGTRPSPEGEPAVARGSHQEAGRSPSPVPSGPGATANGSRLQPPGQDPSPAGADSSKPGHADEM
ncbi:cyclic AMP-responsive element-binding protein 3-like protein 4 [Pristis pectinata]|uniref:cyclic AMP-responsive element-binding protein 3-like protein 4 n=1 Tax=Pristis pectinata TaxID=685728 RepID=UPI00223DB990|nr:cyclic AMP-responsive element-binding protein 3-like protein 4 [Pristis pectinata]